MTRTRHGSKITEWCAAANSAFLPYLYYENLADYFSFATGAATVTAYGFYVRICGFRWMVLAEVFWF